MAWVDVRSGALDVTADEIARLGALIDTDERAHAARFHQTRDRRRFIVRRGRLREWLGRHLGEAPERLAFTNGAFGKPALAGSMLHFSISHSGDRMLAAFADVEVGCDLERCDRIRDWRPIADRLFSPQERAALAVLPEPEGRLGFFACWARKEAFVKAIGLGLSYPLDAFDVSLGPEARLLAGGEGWSISALDIGEDHAAAIVARDAGTPLTIRILSERD